MKTRIQQILTELECVQESFLGFSDDIWLNIEHNDSQAVQKVSEFKVAFNEKLNEFNRISAEISNLTVGNHIYQGRLHIITHIIFYIFTVRADS